MIRRYVVTSLRRYAVKVFHHCNMRNMKGKMHFDDLDFNISNFFEINRGNTCFALLLYVTLHCI